MNDALRADRAPLGVVSADGQDAVNTVAWSQRWAAWRARRRGESTASSADPLEAGAADHLLRQLEWTALRRLDGLLQGDYRTLLRGLGLDLADLREYQPGDDVRHIDWNVTARLDLPHVRRFHESRDMTAWLLVDLSPSMHFGSHGRHKARMAVEAAALMARLFTAHGNRVGAIVFGRVPDPQRDLGEADKTAASDTDAVCTVLPPGSTRAHVLRLIQALLRVQAAGAASPVGGNGGWRGGWRRPRWLGGGDRRPANGPAQTTRLDALLRAAAPMLRSRSTVLVLSDFISEPGWEAPLGHLAFRHEVLAVRLSDPLESALPDLGLLQLQDMETGEHLLVDASDPAFRQRYAALAEAAESRIAAAFAQAGVDALELRTDAALADTLARFCRLRRHRQKLGGGATGRGRPLGDLR